MVEPWRRVENFERLAAIGALGPYGYYESIDYTPSRVPEGATFAIVRAFMAHHQGMTIVALANVLLGSVMRGRFRAEPAVQATELLLQERTPRTVAVARPISEGEPWLHVRDEVPPVLRRFRSPHDPTPRTHLLSNGRYSVMMTAAGSGYSRWRGLDVTRWREDTTRDAVGNLRLLDRRGVRSTLVGRIPARGRRARPLRRHLLRRPRRDSPAGRRHRDERADPRLHGGRRGDPADFADELRGAHPEIDITSYAEIVARSSGRRCRAPGVLESVRPDPVRSRASRPCWPAAGPATARRRSGPRT